MIDRACLTDMTCRDRKNRNNLLVAATLLLFLGIGQACAPVKSGKWYDSDKDGEKPSQGNTAPVPRNAIDTMVDKMRAGIRRIQGVAPKDGVIIVRSGDTYHSLSRRYRVSLRALMEINQASPPYKLVPGEKLQLPRQKTHIVRRKETLYAISRAYQVDVASLARENVLAAPYTIKIGQRLNIPSAPGTAATKTTSRTAPPQTAAKSDSRPAAPVKSARPAVKAPTPPVRAGRFILPVKGRVISEFGPKEGGLHNDGINIAAPIGAEIKASENGVVVYVGNQLRGYGNLLLLRHSGGWVSAYAHTSRFRVKQGDRVRQGEVIAEVGRSGNVDRPQLHFELRKGTRAINPKSLI